MSLRTNEELQSFPLRALPPSPTSSLKRRLMRLTRKSSDGSRSSSSTGSSSTGRSAEAVAFRQPCKSRIRHHTNRLSGVFLRGAASGSLPMAVSTQIGKGSASIVDAESVDDPSELSNQLSAPGILKIFGSEICKGAHYKSVLATTHSSAKELVKEALERYGLKKEEESSFVLCDTIGSIGKGQWKTEGFRVVGDNEKPLLLQSLWKPREGLARRFEIQRRSLVEEQTSRDKDTITAGINAQARKLQKSRSRVHSTLISRSSSPSQKIWRSKSDMDLIDVDSDTKENQVEGLTMNGTSVESPQARAELDDIELAVPSKGDGASQTKTESLCPSRPRGEQEGEEFEREETESSDDNATQYSIHPPHDCPYLLLLHGRSLVQDFVLYLLTSPSIVLGQQNESRDVSQADIVLQAEDILPKHCVFHRISTSGSTMLCPFPGAVVTRNGNLLKEKVQLYPGDVIGLGQSYLFLFKDPLIHKDVYNTAPKASSPTLPRLFGRTTPAPTISPTRDAIRCDDCGDFASLTGKKCLKRRRPFLKSPEGHCLNLNYRVDDEHFIIKQIIAKGSRFVQDGPSLSVSFLMCLCIQYSASYLRTSDLRRLLLLIASEIQSAVWEQTKEISAFPKEVNKDIITGLLPLVAWLSNSLELLQFIKNQLPLILEWRIHQENEDAREEDDDGENLDLLELQLSCVRSASEETIEALEEVIMLTFQQSVYYITKVLYPSLPGFLDCNPFKEGLEGHSLTDESIPPQHSSELTARDGVQQVLEVLSETQNLLLDCQLHPEISTQLNAFLFYFINASLFNLLMERGAEPGFFQRSTGMHIRTNFDLFLNWSQTAGLEKLAFERTRALSSAICLLTTPKKNLFQTSWTSLRSDFPALNAAQLNHLLSIYIPTCPARHKWNPCARDQTEAHRTEDILQSFDTHHPLVLPDEDYQFIVGSTVTDSGLIEHLNKLRVFIFNLSNLQQHQAFTEANFIQETMETPEHLLLSQPTVQTLQSLPDSPPSTPSSIHGYLDDLSSCGAHLLSQKLRNLELQTGDMESNEISRSTMDRSCLLTPPNTPLILDPVHLPKEDQDAQASSDEGGLMSECLAALKDDHLSQDYTSMKRIFELIEEEEEEAEDVSNHFDDNNDEIFSLELERDGNGLGLALIDTRDMPLKVKGIFIRAVVPDSPAARCEKLQPGDRILAVNGVSLLGPNCLSGKDLMQSSGDRLRLLVVRSDWMAKAIQTEC
ncbi:ras-associating and dilute domain-containing protein isoform X1 [Corythoichthys intestinalis]|uniref:ras-associating and dilute domain-containing protein isoform X1 n=1 Tax=Corythoichthys intestinalis TaxID=161448 RepID=UPI0025A64498|nr:ras-associating and dilute domain-containing protein isoform X1 [Corythoichthys intestinalis]XP_057682982.1 ras-associating and dilute domain-containing protein isoform X1 [Corythoichthys intestinalis]